MTIKARTLLTLQSHRPGRIENAAGPRLDARTRDLPVTHRGIGAPDLHLCGVFGFITRRRLSHVRVSATYVGASRLIERCCTAHDRRARRTRSVGVIT